MWWWAHLLLIASSWTMIGTGFWANPDGTIYPASQFNVPKYIFVGTMDCGAKLLDLHHIQLWCKEGGDTTENEVVRILDNQTVNKQFYSHAPNGPVPLIAWMFAFIEGNPTTIGYQVTWQVDQGKPQSMLSGQF